SQPLLQVPEPVRPCCSLHCTSCPLFIPPPLPCLPPFPVYPRSPPLCSGCTGCSNDCNGRGTCALDSDFNPYCKCQNQFDPAKACTVCKQGYTIESKCVACAPWFFSGQKGRCTVCGTVDKVGGSVDKVGGRDYKAWQKGRCSVCGSVDKVRGCDCKACEREGPEPHPIPPLLNPPLFPSPSTASLPSHEQIQDLTGELSNLNNATQAASSKRCQQMCQRAQSQTKLYKNYCNLWAFVENR
ncbi:unnamed protein product, partial [Closterium sp. Naga37s-1]